jgi:hypothetical protein
MSIVIESSRPGCCNKDFIGYNSSIILLLEKNGICPTFNERIA